MRGAMARPGWTWLKGLIGLIVALPGLVAAQSGDRGPVFGPVPAWVRGVEDVANVQIRFDPAYQTLTLHRIEVLRGGKPVSRAAPGAVKLLQREASLESLIYDGSLTAHVALQDVRVGDVVQTVYSLQGFNPVFGARRFGSFDFDWGMPVAYRHARLLWPAGRPLHWKLHNGATPARVTEAGGEREHRWQLHDVPARMVDNDSPGWHDPHSWAEWGEFADWAGVAQWALPLYRLPDGPQPAVDREVARIAAQTADPEQRLLAALRFVQREVRYLGIEMGANSHEPHPPEQVLQRRYGDCKDKTLLSLALLRGLGIPARAALVHTRARHTLAARLPTPWAFNHVLVQADLGGRRVWLDPTRRPQGGESVAHWVQSDFGRALLVDAEARDLVPMAAVAPLRREVRTLLDASAGFDQPATLTVTTLAQGESAERLREALATTARKELQKQYLDYYAASFPGLVVAQPMAVRDDVDTNAIEVVERYRMPSYWVRDDPRRRWTGELSVPDLQDWLRSPTGLNRTSPLALRHPVEFKLVSEFRLPGAWDIKPDTLVVEDAAFTLRRQEAWKGSTLTLSDQYLSRSDHVPAADMARYVAALEKARTGVNFSLYRTDDGAGEGAATDGSDAPHWLPACVTLVALSGLGWLALRLYRWDPTPVPLPPGSVAESAIGGWLWLPLIGLGASAFHASKAVVDAAPALTVQGWHALTLPGAAAYHPLWGPVLLGDLVASLAIVLGAVLIAWLMLNRRSSTPRLYIGWWVLVVTTALVEAGAFQLIPALRDDWTSRNSFDTVRNGVLAVIWCSYMRRSERVRRTFQQRLATRAAGDPQSPATQPA